jgi:hypothetical protein
MKLTYFGPPAGLPPRQDVSHGDRTGMGRPNVRVKDGSKGVARCASLAEQVVADERRRRTPSEAIPHEDFRVDLRRHRSLAASPLKRAALPCLIHPRAAAGHASRQEHGNESQLRESCDTHA